MMGAWPFRGPGVGRASPKRSRNLRFRALFAAVGLTMLIFTVDAFARGGRGGRGGGYSRGRAGNYGTVRRSTTAGGGQANYHREVTGSRGRSANSSGSATRGDGQADWNREVTTSGGRSADVSGSATYGDGRVNYEREVSGSRGGTASTKGRATYDDGQVNRQRTTVVEGAGGASRTVRVGSTVTTLPAGYTTVAVAGGTYYYHGGYYYRRDDDDDVTDYTVVMPPIGTVVYELPNDCGMMSLGEEESYYICEGVYYHRKYVNGRVAYVVVEYPR